MDSGSSAKEAGLEYVNDTGPGLRREKRGKAFRYLDSQGRPCTAQTVARIKALAIPPAWTDVWICPNATGHIQATGRDQRKRKQYRYHARWREVRDTTKFEKLVDFASVLPKIRHAVQAALKRPMSRLKLLASVVHLLERTHIRIGNDEYARQNGHFGLTTLRARHVRIDGAVVHFRFLGKSGVKRVVDLEDRRLARIIRQCQALPGHELFRYADPSGRIRHISSGDVNDFLRQVAGSPLTAKEFRTWAGTMLAAKTLATMRHETAEQAKRNIVAAVKEVSARLGNTPAVCRRSYIHPAILRAYVKDDLRAAMAKPRPAPTGTQAALDPEELAVRDLIVRASAPSRRKAA